MAELAVVGLPKDQLEALRNNLNQAKRIEVIHGKYEFQYRSQDSGLFTAKDKQGNEIFNQNFKLPEGTTAKILSETRQDGSKVIYLVLINSQGKFTLGEEGDKCSSSYIFVRPTHDFAGDLVFRGIVFDGNRTSLQDAASIKELLSIATGKTAQK